MPHLEIVSENRHISDLIRLEKLEKFSHPEHGYFKMLVEQYRRPFTQVSDKSKISAVYEPTDPGPGFSDMVING